METISNSNEGSVVLNIPAWLSRATLDAIGEGTCYPGTQTPFSHLVLSRL
jgi:hypothetical protein